MGRRKRPLPLIENLEIIDAGAEGKAVGRWNEKVVFVPYGAPGDILDVQVFKKKRSFYEAKITQILAELHQISLNSENQRYVDWYQVSLALNLKHSDRMRDKFQAQLILGQIVNQKNINAEIKIIAILNLADSLIDELLLSKNCSITVVLQ